MHFLDGIDHRDGMMAASIFTEDGVVHTNDGRVGDLKGKDEISRYVKECLQPFPKLPPGTEHPCHRMINHAEGTDAISPAGNKYHFDVELDSTSGLIKSLSRVPLAY
jgi:alkylated DNA nucleotide flippase Atl1